MKKEYIDRNIEEIQENLNEVKIEFSKTKKEFFLISFFLLLNLIMIFPNTINNINTLWEIINFIVLFIALVIVINLRKDYIFLKERKESNILLLKILFEMKELDMDLTKEQADEIVSKYIDQSEE